MNQIGYVWTFGMFDLRFRVFCVFVTRLVCFCFVLFFFLLVVLGFHYLCACDRLERLVSEMTCNVLTRTLNPTHSLVEIHGLL